VTTPFRQVKASAGSGKTYALTRRFLELLAGSCDEEGPVLGYACAADAGRAHAYDWPEILAITFTNKAAAEMRERVLGALKLRALGKGEGPGPDAAKSRRLLLDILRHTEHLGIRTIDSLLSLLVRVFALDQGLPPDFDTLFDDAKAIDELFERFLARCEDDGPEAALYEQAVHTLIAHEDKAGFWLARPLRERLTDLTRKLLQQPPEAEPVTTDQVVMAGLLTVSFDDMRVATDALLRALDDHSLDASAHLLNLLRKCADATLFGGLPDSKLLAKDTLAECLLAKARPRCGDAAERAYARFKEACAEYQRDHAVLNAAYALAPCAGIAARLLAGLPALQREKGFVFGGQMAAIAGGALDGGAGVPDAFCRLGDRLHHLLVDEFQDTSRAQWNATLPLAAECLAKGGSLFYVGDVKQAIYGWRGGDARLFDEVGEDAELDAMSGGLSRESLPCNWRSSPEIIGFNNAVFGKLADPVVAEDLAELLLPAAPQDITEDFTHRLNAAFAGCAQEVPPAKRKPGRVRIRLLPSGKAEEVLDCGLDALVDALKNDILPRRRPGDVAVLVRSGTHADLVCDRLVREGIPLITENSLQLARHPIVRQLVALLRLLDAPPDDVSLLEFLCGPELFLAESGLTAAHILDWASHERKGGLLSRFRDDFPEAHERLLAPFLRGTGLMRPYDLVQAALDTYQVAARHPEAELYVRRFLEVIHLAEAQGMGSLPRLLEFWAETGVEEKVPLPESADAVRILTIHKSKGLQYPVCIVPFHNWSAGRSAELGVVEVRGHRVLTRVTKALGAPYYRNAANSLLEQANLLYVAWTRAEEELYAFVPDAGGKQRLGAMPVLLGRLLDIPPEEAGLEIGGEAPAGAPEPPCAAPGSPTDGGACLPAPEVPPRESTPEFQSWLPRLRVFRHSLEDAGYDERTRGKVAHKAVELLRPSGDATADCARAAALAIGEFPELRALPGARRDDLRAEVEAMLGWLLAQPLAADLLGGGGAELTILNEEGEALRPDLLRFTESGPRVLEFKTGAAKPEHARQLRGYLRLSASLAARRGQPTEPLGFLVYLDRRVLEPVRLDESHGETSGGDA
jgi:ATP-dependent exoDNAse (exonuclease V) beta subunit